VPLIDTRTARVLTTICVFLAAGAFLYGVRHTIVVFLFAIFFAYLLEPVVSWIERSPISHHSRGLAIAETYIGLLLLLTILGVTFGPRLVEDTRGLATAAPNLLQNVTSGKIVWQLGNKHNWSYDTQRAMEQTIAEHRQEILQWMTKLGRELANFLANLVWVALIPILAAFFLAQGEKFVRNFINAFDRREQRRLLRGVIEDLDQVLARFILAQLTVASFSIFSYLVVLSLLRFPYSITLAVAGGLMEFIPVVGPLLAAVVILGVGFLSGFHLLWVVLLFLGVWRMCQDYVISPRIMGRGVELHPLVAIAAVLMGAELGGVLGVYLSIPIAAAVRVIWNRWRRNESEQEAASLREVVPRSPRNRAIS